MHSIGAFVSTAGGLQKVPERATALGVDAIMIFATSPHSWRRRMFSDEEIAAFRAAFVSGGFDSLWIHGTYLMNFGAADPAALKRSVDCLIQELKDCERLGGKGVIFHPGSHGGRGFETVLPQIVEAMRTVLASTDESGIVLECSAGMGGSIGSKLEEVAAIFSEVPDKRLQFCFDTQHAFAAGYPIHEQAGLAAYLDEIDRLFGLERLVAIHANDSKVPLAGGRDRHENISQGYIGEAGFRVLTHAPRLTKVPFLLEVPGYEGKGPDKPNVDHLRVIAQSTAS